MRAFKRFHAFLLQCLIFLFGLGMMLYPLAGAYWNQQHESEVCLHYQQQAKQKLQTDEKHVHSDLTAAQEYNRVLAQTVFSMQDPFAQRQDELSAYESILNVTEDGVMAYVDIPKISVHLPIYHGTDTEVLKKGIGHLPETSFPSGGSSTHAVLSGHTGMKYAKLFTDLGQMKEGDFFYIYVYEQRLSYQVDQIKTVLPTDTEELHIIENEDHVTLMTCTPYGVNSHRLLVRGTRVFLPENEEYLSDTGSGQATQTEQEIPSAWEQEYWNSLKLGLLSAAGALLAMYLLCKRKNKDKDYER